jgi:hypothetical protein
MDVMSDRTSCGLRSKDCLPENRLNSSHLVGHLVRLVVHYWVVLVEFLQKLPAPSSNRMYHLQITQPAQEHAATCLYRIQVNPRVERGLE